MEFNKKFISGVGMIVLTALEKSGADMSQIYADEGQQKPNPIIFKNISGQFAETVKKGGKK